MKHKIELGSEVECSVTKIKGKLMALTYFKNGCIQCEIQAKGKKDGSVPDAISTDIQDVIVIKPKLKEKEELIGGKIKFINRMTKKR